MKKKIVIIIVMLVCVCFLPPINVNAKTKEYAGTCGENATWHLDKKGNLMIFGTGAVTDVGWKSLSVKYDVTQEGNYGGKSSIKSVVIADGITEIGKSIFDSTEIRKIYVPDSVKKIGDYTFQNCTDLKSVRLPKGLESIGRSAFRGCTALSQIMVPSTVTHIGGGAFAGCYALKTFKNQSNQTYKLECAKGKITWRIGKKKVTEVSARQTAKSQRKKYKIKYVLNGGKIKGKKKTSYRFWEDIKLPKAKKKGYAFLGWSEWSDSERVLNRTTKGNLKLHAVFKKVSVKKVDGRRIKVSVKPANSKLVVQYDKQKDLDKGEYWEFGTYYEPTVGVWVSDSDGDGEVITKKLKKGKTYYFRWGLECEEEEGIRWFGKKKIKM